MTTTYEAVMGLETEDERIIKETSNFKTWDS